MNSPLKSELGFVERVKTKCRQFLRITALGVCTIYCLGVSVSFNTTPGFLSVVTCTSVPEVIGGGG